MEIDRIVGGVRQPRMTTDEILEAMKTFEIRTDDIWVITYPKAGTTWMQEIISILYNNCDITKADEIDLRQRFDFLDILLPGQELAHNVAKRRPSPRFLKTHLPSHQMAKELTTKKPKIVYVARNPKDNAVSIYYYNQSNKYLRTYESWDECYEAFYDGDVHCGSWFDMNLYWWNRRNDDNVLFVKYEDMKKDLGTEIIRISEFLGLPIPDGKLVDVIEHCTFSSMKKNPKTNMKSTIMTTTPFMRKGEVGDWKNHFTVRQSEELDRLYEEKMKDTGLTFEYEL